MAYTLNHLAFTCYDDWTSEELRKLEADLGKMKESSTNELLETMILKIVNKGQLGMKKSKKKHPKGPRP